MSWLREVGGPTRASTAVLSWVGLSLNQHPSCPLALLTLFLLFFREPIGKKRSGKDSFSSLLVTPTPPFTHGRGLLLWGELPAPWQPNPCSAAPRGSPAQRAPSIHWDFTAASKPPSHIP